MRYGVAALSIIVLASSQATATVSRPEPEDEIVVVGEAMREAQRQAQAYVQEVGIAAGNRPTARWLDPVCPKAVGLAPDKEAIVERQVRELALQVGAPLAKGHCTPNLMILFTDGPEAVVERLARKSNGVLREVPSTVAKEIRSGAAPVRWFYQTDVRSREGTQATDALHPSLFATVEGNAEPANIGYGRGGLLHVKNSSHISSQAMRSIKHATVIVDVDRASGTSLRAVTDYAAVVGLAEIAFAASPARSILSLFDSRQPVTALTRTDLAMLTGLYHIHLDRKAEQQRRTLVNRMVKTDVTTAAQLRD